MSFKKDRARRAHLEVRHDDKVGVLDRDRAVAERLDDKVVAEERQGDRKSVV